MRFWDSLDPKNLIRFWDFWMTKSSFKIELQKSWFLDQNRPSKSSSEKSDFGWKIGLQNRAPKIRFWMKNRSFFDHFLSVCLKSSKNPVQQGQKSGCWTENRVFRRKTVKKPSKIDHFLNFFEKSSKIHPKSMLKGHIPA